MSVSFVQAPPAAVYNLAMRPTDGRCAPAR
jgi:hypothetical protein